MRWSYTGVLLVLCACAAACDLFVEEDEPQTFDNVAACQEFEGAVNSLPCAVYSPLDADCEGADTDASCDYSEYYNCMLPAYLCEGDNLITDVEISDECFDIADKLSQEC